MDIIVGDDYSGKSDFKPVPSGTHLARCYRVVDLGTQRGEWNGEVKYTRKIMVQFEIHGEDENDQPIVTEKGEPMTISKNYNKFFSDKSTLRRDMQTWRGRPFTDDEARRFSMKNILGVWAMVSVVTGPGRNGNIYANIQSINPVPSAIKKAGLPEPFNPISIFSLENPDMEVFETLGKKTKEKIINSPEWKSRVEGKSEPKPESSHKKGSFEDMADDIQF